MTDLNVIAFLIEEIVEREIGAIAAVKKLNTYQIKDLETLNKMLVVCMERRKGMTPTSWTDGASTADLESEFENGV